MRPRCASGPRHPVMRLATLALVAGLVVPLAFAQPRDTGWPMHGGRDNIRFSALDQINRTNVDRLQVAWTYEAGDHFKGSEMQSNPVVVDGTLYVTTPTLQVAAVDAATGRERWKFDPSGGSGSRARFRHRGVTVHNDRVFVTYEGRNTNGGRFRNTEILTIRNELIVDVEVYFGWSLPHKAPPGGFVNEVEPK